MKKYSLSDYFVFSKKERMGIYVLILLCITAALIPYWYSSFHSKVSDAFIMTKNQLDSLNFNQNRINNNYYASNFLHFQKEGIPSKQIVLFDFDPNTLDGKGWQKLGLTDKNIHTIENYLSKGGRFYQADDLKKIWGIRTEKIYLLLPFVKIQTKNLSKKRDDNSLSHSSILTMVDINVADSTSWESLPGIGPKLAQRIVLFREKLGGFYKIDQVAETFGLQDSVFKKIRSRLACSNKSFRLIDINSAELNQLVTHPYLRFKLAKALIQYRNQHGLFQSISDLKKIILFNDSILAKVSPYLTIQ